MDNTDIMPESAVIRALRHKFSSSLCSRIKNKDSSDNRLFCFSFDSIEHDADHHLADRSVLFTDIEIAVLRQ